MSINQVQKERQLRDLRRQPVSKNKNISSSSNLRSQNHQNVSILYIQTLKLFYLWKPRIYEILNVIEPVQCCRNSNANQVFIHWHKCGCGRGLLFISAFNMPIECNVSGLLYSFKFLLLWQIKLGETGWKERFYAEKFKAETEDDRERIRSHAVRKSTMKLISCEFCGMSILFCLCISLFISNSKFWAHCLGKSLIWKEISALSLLGLVAHKMHVHY